MSCCMLGAAIVEQDFIIAVPPAPEGPLTLSFPMGSEVAGLYNMDPHQAIPTTVDNTTMRYPTGFLIRVRGEVERGYFWMVSRNR